jgi:hypothetical protein
MTAASSINAITGMGPWHFGSLLAISDAIASKLAPTKQFGSSTKNASVSAIHLIPIVNATGALARIEQPHGG